MSKKLISREGISVLSVSTNQTRRENSRASIPSLRLLGEEVDEQLKYRVCRVGEPVWAEHFLDCVGSLVIASTNTMMTHHFATYLVENGDIFQAFGEVERATSQLKNGTAIIWRKQFSDATDDRTYKQAVELWFKMLSHLYTENMVRVYDLVFDDWEWPLSAYYDGGSTLKLAANIEDTEKLQKAKVNLLK